VRPPAAKHIEADLAALGARAVEVDASVACKGKHSGLRLGAVFDRGHGGGWRV
jgi:hypothetical protein